MVIESFAGYSSLGWHLCSLRVCMRSAQDLLAFMVSGEKSGVVLIGLPLYVTWPFSLTAFNILCLEHLVFYYVTGGISFLVQSIWSSVGFLCVHRNLFLARLWWQMPLIPALVDFWVEAGGFLSLRPAWSREWVPRQPGIYRETLSWKTIAETTTTKWNPFL